MAKESELSLEKIAYNDIIGIVSGASAPDWKIREVITRMSEMEKTMAGNPVENDGVETGAAAAVREKGQVGERDEFAARNLETPFHRHHHHGYDERGEDEAVEENGGIAQMVGCRAFFHRHGEEGNKAVAYGGYQTENDTFYV